MEMRFAYQTIIYGWSFGQDEPEQIKKAMERAFDAIASAGFEGIELFQKPRDLHLNSYEQLEAILGKKLVLAGMSGGSLSQMAEFLGGHKTPYLYTDCLPREESLEVLGKGYTIAIHPHAFKAIHNMNHVHAVYQNKDFRRYFESGHLKLLPDTAHGHIVGDDVLFSCQRFRTELAGLHLKGWYAGYGRMSHRYSQGFCGIWEGDAPVRAVAEELKKEVYKNPWIVVEQDYGEQDPEQLIFRSAETLRNWKLPIRDATPMTQSPRLATAHSSGDELDTFRVQAKSRLQKPTTSNLDECYEGGLKAIRDLLNCNSAVLIGLQIVNDLCGETSETKLLCGPLAISSEEQVSDLHSLCCLEGNEPEVGIEGPIEFVGLGSLQADWEKSIWKPGYKKWVVRVENAFNLNQPRYSLWLYREHDFTIRKESSTKKLQLAAQALARYLDRRLDQICTLTSSRVDLVAARTNNLEDCVYEIRKTIQETCLCQGAIVFSKENSGMQLVPVGDTESLKWESRPIPQDQVYDLRKDATSKTVQVFRSGIPRFTMEDPAKHTGLSHMILDLPTAIKRIFVATVPMVQGDGKSLGVVRCVNRIQGKQFRFFHDDDVARIDAALQSAIPRIQAARAEWERRHRLRKVTHELKRPLSVIFAAIESIEEEWNDRRRQYGFADLPFPWFDDVKSWNQIMQFQVKNPDYLSVSARKIHLRVEPVKLVPEVVAPIVRWMGLELNRRKLPLRRGSDWTIDQGNSLSVDPIHVDRNMFQQIFFNLLDNAIKYAKPDQPNRFKIEMRYELTKEGGVIISFRDWGIGVEEVDDPNLLFEDGVRATNAYRHDLNGTGYGLWVVRRLVELHQGTITITNKSNPLVFKMKFPPSIKIGNWYELQPKKELN